MDHLAGNTSRCLQYLEWSRDIQAWNWDDYVAVYMTDHNIIKGLIIHGYAGIDNRTKVLYLCNGIKSSALTPVQAMILANSKLRYDFTWWVTLFAEYMRHGKLPSTREVAKMGTDDGDASQNARRNPRERGFGGKPGGKPSSTKKLETYTIKECYFCTKEYNKFTHMER